MDLTRFFLIQHAAVHASDVSGQAFAAQRVFSELSDDQMRIRPGKGLNSLVWLLWHMARTEDVAVNLVVAGRDQLLDDLWMRRMNVPWRIIGTGMTDDEITEMTAGADVAAVRAYRSAVRIRTREVVRALPADAWDEIVGDEDIKRAAMIGAFRDWVEGTTYPWRGWTRAEQLLAPRSATTPRTSVKLSRSEASPESRSAPESSRRTCCWPERPGAGVGH